MRECLRKVWNAATTVLVVLAVAVALMLVGVRLFGIHPYTVLSGSMEPTYHVGSLIYVKTVDPLELAENDPVTYRLRSGTVVTHRIVEVIPDEEDPNVVRFRTQGDANDNPDGELLHCNNVIGKPVFSIPLLGYAAHFLQGEAGRFLSIGVCMVIIALILLPDLLFGKEKATNAPQQEEREGD